MPGFQPRLPPNIVRFRGAVAISRGRRWWLLSAGTGDQLLRGAFSLPIGSPSAMPVIFKKVAATLIQLYRHPVEKPTDNKVVAVFGTAKQ
jgi:hypothetical protein